MSSNQESDSDDDCYGPALPPHLANKTGSDAGDTSAQEKSSVIGPQLPAHIKRTDLELLASVASNQRDHDEQADDEGQEKPSGDDGADERDDDIGPYLPDDPRNQKIPKARLAAPKQDIPTKREEWMLICPKNRSLAVGLGPRQFLARTPDELAFDNEEEEDDDSNADRFLETARAELANKSEYERDQKMEGLMKASGGDDQKESLLSIHRKRKLLEDAANKSSAPKERRPFDRDTDLKVGGLSQEDKAKFIKKSEELASRFKGGKKKFL